MDHLKNPRLARYIECLRTESVATCPRPEFDHLKFQQDYFAPGGTASKIGERHCERTLRVGEVTLATVDTGLPQLIDHHAGNAWHRLWEFARDGYCPIHVPKLDSPKKVCDALIQFPEGIRDRLDAVLIGMEEIDPEGAYEAEFMAWQRAWYERMDAITVQTKRQHARRLRMCKEAAKALFPQLVEWFESLRREVCDGGHVSAWGWGDDLRGRADSR